MMKNKFQIILIFIALFSVLFLNSCVDEIFFGKSGFRKILYFSMEGQTGNTVIRQDSLKIYLTVSQASDITSLRPDSVLLSTFATLTPAADIARDFSDPQEYTVTAENGEKAVYAVAVKQEGAEPQLENSGFDDWYTPAGKNFQEPGLDENSIWATANNGVTVLNEDNYNTTPLLISSSDYAAQLVTKDLGVLAIGQRMGSATLFTGAFVLNILDPPSSARFGVSFTAKPKGFSVDLKYTAGSPYKDNRGTTLDKTDSADVYVLLENREDENAVKRVGTGWYRFGDISDFETINVNIIYGQLPAETPDYQKPANNLYGDVDDKITHISVVFASSANGIYYEGGVNSTLIVNNFRLIY